uniref:Toll-like receptor 9 n=1 Tax=Erpetoichthys calabaricus TaxID=27687 RepID=A0A8C4TFJ0_ERPCA
MRHLPSSTWFLVSIFLPLHHTIVPQFYPCDDSLNSTVVDCSERHLRKVPTINSNNVISLNLDGNDIHLVKNNDFWDLPSLSDVSIAGNCLPQALRSLKIPNCKMVIERNAFVKLKRLMNLNLSGNSLTSLPKFPESLVSLYLERNHIFHLQYSNFSGLSRLELLYLGQNCYYANPCQTSFFMEEDTMRDLKNLHNLSLIFNNITAVPQNLPNNLEMLDLRENKIERITFEDFANLTNLRYLNLEWNCQRCDHAAQPCFPCPNNASMKIDSNTFQNQENLHYLSLRGNSLRTVPNGLFDPLVKLSRLELSDNLLAYAISNGTFFESLKTVKILSLLYNYEPLTMFPTLNLSTSFKFMRSLEVLLLSGYFFQTLETKSLEPIANLKNLEKMELRMNFINRVNLSVFKQFPKMKKVGLSQNIVAFPPLCSPVTHQPEHMSPKARVVLSPYQYEYCKQNLTFDLSQNNIMSLEPGLFQGMEEAICVDLSSNYISQAPNGNQFSPLKKVQYLNLAYNRIDLYYDNAFQELNNSLKVLDLTHNEYHFLMRGMGHCFNFIFNLGALERLSLADNNIGVRISTMIYSNSLKYLYFGGNRLDLMWDGSSNRYLHFFSKLSQLIFLDLSNNQMRSFPPEALTNLPKTLQVLQVNSNHLEYFPWINLSSLVNLNHLNISYNFLSVLPDLFTSLGEQLSVLDLSYNKIQNLSGAFFYSTPQLRWLNLSHNFLKILDPQNFPSKLQDNLIELVINANPITCTCDSSWFIDFLKKTHISLPHLTKDMKCGFPQSKLDQDVLSIDPRSCQDVYGNCAFMSSFLLTLTFICLPLIKKIFGWDFWYVFHVIWAGLKGYSSLPTFNSEYDAFVTFDSNKKAVADWVYNELRVNLEEKGRKRFKLCLEERDWIVGSSYIQNLCDAVYKSKKTVFVLTNGQSVSGVARQAFFMAQQRLLDEKLDVVVLVLLNEAIHKSKYLQMRKMLCRKTVLRWPKNPHAQPFFWDQMKNVLSSENHHYYDHNFSEVM